MSRTRSPTYIAGVIALLALAAVAMPAAAIAPAPRQIANGDWSEIPAVNPRSGATVVYADGRLVLIGGGGHDPGYNQLWTIDIDATPPEWILLETISYELPELHEHTAVFDPAGHRVIVFGGTDPSGYPLNDVWESTLDPVPNWTHLSPGGTPPPARQRHTAIYDSVRQRMVIFGGLDFDFARLGDVWALSLAGPPEWTEMVVPPGPEPRQEAVAVYDPIGDRMIVSTGFGNLSLGDSWALSFAGTPVWTPLPDGPTPRQGAVAVHDPTGDRMILPVASTAEEGPRTRSGR